MDFYRGNSVAEIRDVVVDCEKCEGRGTVYNSKKEDYVVCPDCDGAGKFITYR